MKHNKLLGVLTLALALGLTACGGPKAPASSGKSGKTSKSNPPKTSISREPVKEAAIESAGLEKGTDNKVYFRVTGTCSLYNAGDLKFAWGIADASDNSFVYGKETPEAADFKADGVTIDATGNFTAKLCLADLTGFAAGKFYNFYGGTTEDTGALYAKIDVTEVESMKDGVYNYCVRDDQSNAIAIEELPPFAFAEESVVDIAEGEHAGRWVKIGGNLADKYKTSTAEDLMALNPAADFQLCGGQWTVRKLTAAQLFIGVEGAKAYVYLSTDGLSAGNGYITHLAIKGAAGVANCYTDNTIGADDADHTFKYAEEGIQYRLYSNPAAGQAGGEAEYFGCFAVIVEALEAAE